MTRALSLALFVLASSPFTTALAEQKWNFPDRKAIVVDVCPHVRITKFEFENIAIGSGPLKNQFTYEWRNVGNQAVLAFELVTLKYDPFDEPMRGSRTLVGGRNSADFAPLLPGGESGDATSGYGHTHVLTAIVYIRAVRLKDGTIWHADPSVVAAELKKVAPRIKNVGPLVPEPEKKDEQKPQAIVIPRGKVPRAS